MRIIMICSPSLRECYNTLLLSGLSSLLVTLQSIFLVKPYVFDIKENKLRHLIRSCLSWTWCLSSKHKDYVLIIGQDKENQTILTSERLKPEKVWHLCVKNDKKLKLCGCQNSCKQSFCQFLNKLLVSALKIDSNLSKWLN